jgi:hypothetical protein
MARFPAHKIIYNWDGAPHSYSETPQSMQAFLEKVYAPLEDTQVGALFWSVGDQQPRWSNEPSEEVGQARYGSTAAYTNAENAHRMLERGENPHTSMIARGRELGLEVYASIRMNDNHFGGAQLSDLSALYKAGKVTAMRYEHPEWLLGERTSEWFALSWNMAIPQVREQKLAHIEEVCRRYDWDGVELDWQRHAFHFPDDEGYRLRYLLTDIQRAVRRLTDELGRQRGRPFYLTARVSSSLEMCRHTGFDVGVWVEQGLVDALMPAGGAVTDASVDVAGFKALCAGSEVAVYPGFDSNLPDPFVGPEEPEEKDRLRTRAIASRYHRAGADGIYIFNWHADRDLKRPLLTQIGSTETLKGTDKIYAATHRFVQRQGDWRGAYRIDRLWGEVPVDLMPVTSGSGPVIVLELAEDLGARQPQRVELRLRLDEWLKEDRLQILWDGEGLPAPQIEYCPLEKAKPAGGAFPLLPRWRRLADVSSAVWMRWDLTVGHITEGPHRVQVVLEERHAQMDCPLVLTDVEVVVAYAET